LTRDQIINAVFNSRQLDAWICRLQREDLRQDLKSEVIETLLLLDDSFLQELHQSGKIIGYAMGAAWNMCARKSSSFNRMYRSWTYDVNDVPDQPVEPDVEMHIEAVLSAVNELPWYDREILKLYADMRSCRAVQKKTNIPHTSINLTVRKSIRTVREKLTNQ